MVLLGAVGSITSEDVFRTFVCFFFFFLLKISSPIHLFLGTILHQHLHQDHDYDIAGHHIQYEDLAFPNDLHVAIIAYKHPGQLELFQGKYPY